LFSHLERQLPAGSYSLELRGHARARGPVVLESQCLGAGCPALPSCLLGSQFSDLRNHERLQIDSEVWITAVDQLTGPLARDQLVLAVQQSSHSDVRTAEEALGRVDQNEVRLMEVDHLESPRRFTVYEYGAGDNSYGAIFAADTLELVASIHDGELLDCTFTD
jgi:hypothetical protein